jgi:hypothetical protein
LNNCLNSDAELTKNCQDLTKNFLYSYLFNFSSLPLGWTQSNLNQQFNSGENIVIQLFKVIMGWGLTAIAISMGSSFWFDILNKLINVRNTGSKPQS